jgi:hypothetical protein
MDWVWSNFKRFFCWNMDKQVEVEFLTSDGKAYDVASCTAFTDKYSVTCDKPCLTREGERMAA